MPSLMDDDAFLEELDKLVAGPSPAARTTPPAHGDFWAPEPHVGADARALEMAAEDQDLGSFLEPELEPELEPAVELHSAPAVQPERERRYRPELARSFQVEAAPIAEPLPIRRGFTAVTPAHAESPSAASVAARADHAAGVPRLVAALLIVICAGAGAGASAYVFRDRVSQIVTTWTARSR